MGPHALDDIILTVALVLPAWIVLRSGYTGIFFGALLHWGLLIVAGEVLAATVHDRGFNLDALWILFGWIPSLVFCGMLYAAKRGMIRVWNWWFGVGAPCANQPGSK
ncbi:MAG TPA: hypothetical protein VN541_16450 [Tepidisphaeraceae bacterium]|nr:hypothetical protein [Tepidisphaeraceae bacterium]